MTNSLEFGALFQAADPQALRRRAETAEALGFDLIGLGDSQLLFRNVYISLAVVGAATRRIRLGPTVTNTITRHPAVTAQAIASIDELTDGRAFLGMGTGDSSAMSIGRKAVAPEDLARTAEMIRALVAGESVDFGGPSGNLRWSKRRVPILFSGDGPRIVRAAGRVADGVILGSGISQDALARSLGYLAEGARSASRDPADLETWAFVKVSFAPSSDAAIEPLRATLAAAAQRNFRYSPLAKGFPAELLPALQNILENYAVGRHGDTDAGGNARLLTDSRLATYLADRFAFYGPPSQVRQQILRARDAGVHRFLLTCSGADPDALLLQLGREIVAQLK